MRFLAIDRVEPGSRLAKPLYGPHGVVLLRQNVILTESILSRLKQKGYSGLFIEDEISEGIVIYDVVDEELKFRTASRLESILSQNGNLEELKPLITEIVDSIISNADVEINMNYMWTHHEYTYFHCVNVGILAVSIGIKLDLCREELINLGTAGILHDIGKKDIPVEILDKPGKLSDEEYDMIKLHPEYGYYILADADSLSSATKIGVLEHHERYDGSGYPRGLKGDEITLFGRILAVADTFDAMTSDRTYRNAYSPSEAVEFLMGTGNHLYDSKVIHAFIRCVTVYPVGTCVELSDGTQGIILKNYSDNVLRPLVRNIITKEIIDLKNDPKYLNLCISKVIV